MILAGDISGTKTNLALFATQGSGLHLAKQDSFPSREFRTLEEIVTRFLGGPSHSVRAACFGIAGPVQQGKVQATNLPWLVDAGLLARTLSIRRVTLLNDLEATAHAIPLLPPERLCELNPHAVEKAGNAAVIAAGTGLGEGGMYWDGRQHHPFASEGGHADFAPRNERELELWRFLQKEFGRVSYERVLSGPGLYNIYRFLRQVGRGAETAELAQRLQNEDPASVVSQMAIAHRCELCVAAVSLFVSIFGAEAGNLALKLLPTAGVYVGGGIAPKLLEILKDGVFLEAFLAKGRMRRLLEGVPIRVILDEKAALWGAARCAAHAASEE